jgi:hypothetical protein
MLQKNTMELLGQLEELIQHLYKANILGAGVQTAALNAGGSRITPPGAINVSAEYNGTAWTKLEIL